jgi:Fungal Zn(2)-Cys(6) binuclear cluster domain
MPEKAKERRITKACDQCSRFRRKCTGLYPCALCVEKGRTCSYSKPAKKRGPESKSLLQFSPLTLPATPTVPIVNVVAPASEKNSLILTGLDPALLAASSFSTLSPTSTRFNPLSLTPASRPVLDSALLAINTYSSFSPSSPTLNHFSNSPTAPNVPIVNIVAPASAKNSPILTGFDPALLTVSPFSSAFSPTSTTFNPFSHGSPISPIVSPIQSPASPFFPASSRILQAVIPKVFEDAIYKISVARWTREDFLKMKVVDGSGNISSIIDLYFSYPYQHIPIFSKLWLQQNIEDVPLHVFHVMYMVVLGNAKLAVPNGRETAIPHIAFVRKIVDYEIDDVDPFMIATLLNLALYDFYVGDDMQSVVHITMAIKSGKTLL